GEAEFFAQLGTLMLMAFAGIYFLLAVTFRSYAQPVMILSVIPFAIVGATLGHLICNTSFALFSWLGVIAAIGVVVNDNVVLVDRCNQIRGYFAMRPKRAGAMIPLDEDGEPIEIHDVPGPNGVVLEYIVVAPDLDGHE